MKENHSLGCSFNRNDIASERERERERKEKKKFFVHIKCTEVDIDTNRLKMVQNGEMNATTNIASIRSNNAKTNNIYLHTRSVHFTPGAIHVYLNSTASVQSLSFCLPLSLTLPSFAFLFNRYYLHTHFDSFDAIHITNIFQVNSVQHFNRCL